MKKTTTLFAGALFLLATISAFGREARLVRYPHYHNGRIVFTYLGDIWTADENGQNVQRMLTDGADTDKFDSNTWAQNDLETLQPGQIGGIVVDPHGAVIVGANVTVTNTQTGASLTTKSDGNGNWVVAGVQPGAVSVNVSASGFKTTRTDLQFQASQPARMGTTLEVGTVNELVTITSGVASEINSRQIQELALKSRDTVLNTASQNVTNLQRRVAGILPVAIEVPRSGKSYRFVRPLVLDEETRVTFTYKSR